MEHKDKERVYSVISPDGEKVTFTISVPDLKELNEKFNARASPSFSPGAIFPILFQINAAKYWLAVSLFVLAILVFAAASESAPISKLLVPIFICVSIGILSGIFIFRKFWMDYLREREKQELQAKIEKTRERTKELNEQIKILKSRLEVEKKQKTEKVEVIIERKTPERRAIEWSNMGMNSFHSDNYQRAIKCLDKALAIDPECVLAWGNKGVVLRDLGKYREAIECFDKALAIEPKDKSIWHTKGGVLKKMGKNEEAEECFKKVEELEDEEMKELEDKK